MARTCGKCGAAVGDKARFCGKCGEVIQTGQPVQSSAETIPTWSGWDVPATASPQAPQGQQTSAVRFSQPKPASAPSAATASSAASSAPPVGSSAPQFWESYDYEGSRPAGQQTQAYSPSAGAYEPRSDASRPLPKLDDLLGSKYTASGSGADRPQFDELDDDLEARRAKAYDTITTFSLWCAGLVLFPMPFVDLVFLVPIQSAMVVAVGKIYGVNQTPEKTVALLAGACGASVFGQFTTLFLASFIPIVGKVISAPFIFGWTYGMGEVAIRYFESKGTATKDELKQIFKKASKEASKNYDSSKVSPREALENIRNYVSEDEYRKIRDRFGPANS
ncbi:MAG: hypothetical protein Q4F00_01890 [bacterium]|nr:hypothetical protein [bacterium]